MAKSKPTPGNPNGYQRNEVSKNRERRSTGSDGQGGGQKKTGHLSESSAPGSRASGENPLGDVSNAGLRRTPLPEVKSINAEEGDPHTPGGVRQIGAKRIK